MILGYPKNKENYICVESVDAEKLHKIGFVPVYREINNQLVDKHLTNCNSSFQ